MNPLLETWRSAGPDHNHLQEPYWTIEQANCPGRSEEGTHNDPCNITTVGQEMVAGCDEGLSYTDLEQRAAIIAAAPRMLRLWLKHEWGTAPDDDFVCCIVCGEEFVPAQKKQHDSKCQLDLLLTELGFSDTASRDAARKLIEALP